MYLACQAQEKLPFHLEGVTSNDALFKSVDFKIALVEKITQISSNIEEEISKVSALNGDLALDSYLVVHLAQCIMTLLSTFEPGERLTHIVKKIVKVI